MTRTIQVKLPGQPQSVLIAGGYCSPCVAAELTAQTQAVQKTYFGSSGIPDGAIPTQQASDPSTEARWSGPLVFEGVFTGDGRYIVKDALRTADLPMPLRWAPTDVGAHGGAMVVGLIETLTRRDDGSIWGTGYIDTSTEEGQKVAAGLENGTIKGVSADLDDMSMEVRVKQELIDEINLAIKEMMESEPMEDGEDIDIANGEKPNEDGYTKVAEYDVSDEVMYITDARMRAATLVDIPAFAEAYVALIASGVLLGDDERMESDQSVLSVLLASAPVNPPAAWFASPKLDGPTPLTFTSDGRVYGHIALWGTCHTGFASQCVQAPNSATNYAWFRTGALITGEGSEVAVGHITMGTGHADTVLSAGPAVAHYDNTGTAAADVAAGEDAYGIWVSGALRPGITEEQLRTLRSSPMSGDWRTVGGNLELVSILAVNMPGFMVPRTKALVASGRTTTLLSPVPHIAPELEMAPTKVSIFAKEAQKLRLKKLAAKAGV